MQTDSTAEEPSLTSFTRLCAKSEQHLCVLWFLKSLASTHKFSSSTADKSSPPNRRTITRNIASTSSAAKNIDLSHLRISEFSIPGPAVSQLATIRILQLQSNLLNSLPSTLFQLRKLEELNLGYNCLKSLPPEIGQLRNLRELFLHGNSLESLPQQIGMLEKLEVLDISNNRMRYMPAEVARLLRLRMLWIDDNRFSPTFLQDGVSEDDTDESSLWFSPIVNLGEDGTHQRSASNTTIQRDQLRLQPTEPSITTSLENEVGDLELDDSQFSLYRQHTVLTLADVAAQAAGEAIASNSHAYCSLSAQCRVQGHTNKRFVSQSRRPGENENDSVDYDCVLNILSSPILSRLRITSRTAFCSECQRPLYHAGILVSGMLLKCSKILPVLYRFCSYECRKQKKK